MSYCSLFEPTEDQKIEIEKKERKEEIFFQDYGFYPNEIQLKRTGINQEMFDSKTDACNADFEDESFRMGYDMLDLF